jgi:glutamate-1-semialdehyde 2,1-aminomutase
VQPASSIYVTGSFWFSAVPMAAAVATLAVVRTSDYLERMIARAEEMRKGIAEQAAAHGFGIRQTGPAQMPQIFFADDPDMRIGYFWAAAAVRRGVYLHPYHNMFATSALTEADIAKTLAATDEAFAELKRAWANIPPQSNPAVLARIQSKALNKPR